MLNDLFTYDGGNSLSFVVSAFFIGAVIACGIMLYNIKVPGRMVRNLSKLGANSPEKAVGARECGFKSERVLRFILSERSALSKYVHIISDEQAKKGKNKAVSLKNAKFYLDEETRIRAEMRYDGKNANLLTVIVGILLLGALAAAMLIVIPDLLQMLKNFIDMFKA